ncbi:hypothetical protein EXIGLDRAFT_724501 [Exidia glandulosa HHB12029]|uniref:F-box domain-containing protein n=1 Tax=Exidia glandulosa HHB12029 TaxID=1314781 RepID=A0A165EDE5_EXIGL|nr:hypothetical protein EXIGLDRAFT_724501 [Exidia glandulosa HHB12029]
MQSLLGFVHVVSDQEYTMDIAAKVTATTVELTKFTTLARRILEQDWTAAPSPVRDAVLRLRSASCAAEKAVDALAAATTKFRIGCRRAASAASLPNDVLHEIFRAWFALGTNPRSSRVPAVFTAASVNKQWRCVALQSGSFWASITIDFAQVSNVDDHIDIILKRSQGYPLDLTIRGAPLTVWIDPSADRLAKLFSASRTINIHFAWPEMDEYEPDDCVLTLFQTALPLAESIICSNFCTESLLPTGMQLFTLCPNLRRLDMDAIPFEAVDWSLVPQLTTFATTRFVTESQLHTLCTSCPGLTELSLRDLDTTPNGTARTMPDLRRLHCTGPYVLQYFGQRSAVPALHTLESGCTASILVQLLSFIHDAPWTSLRVLQLARVWNSDTAIEFLNAMRHLPNLDELRLLYESDCLVHFFQRWEKADCVEIAPKLQSLVLRQCSFPPSATRALAAFLLARTRVGKKIRRLEIVQEGLMPYETGIFAKWMTPRFEQLVDEVVIDVDTVDLVDYSFL